MKRFIKEYANYQKKSIINNELMKKDIKEYGLSRIDKILEITKRGLISTDEAMNLISNIFNERYNNI